MVSPIPTPLSFLAAHFLHVKRQPRVARHLRKTSKINNTKTNKQPKRNLEIAEILQGAVQNYKESMKQEQVAMKGKLSAKEEFLDI